MGRSPVQEWELWDTTTKGQGMATKVKEGMAAKVKEVMAAKVKEGTGCKVVKVRGWSIPGSRRP